jgi:hypothetical protein
VHDGLHASGADMTAALLVGLLVGLLVLSAWLAVKLGTAHKDNADLRVRIESLKRQLVRMR